MTRLKIIGMTVALTAAVAAPAAWWEIDRSPPLEYVGGWFEQADAPPGTIIERAAPGQTVVLALKIKWPRTNCSTELERRFIGSNGEIYKVPRAPDEPVHLGPPPAKILQPDTSLISRRKVVIPHNLPEGIATHSPNAWERCTSPAEKWGDYLTDIWPIFVGPKGAEIPIEIKRR